jgi:nucleoid-associated protein YgaU
MTRENKLALVVGFGLVLFVGILISDHFSAARRQQAADLLPATTALADVRRNDRELIDMAPDEPPAPPIATHTTELTASETSRDVQPLPQDNGQPPVFVDTESPVERDVRVVDLEQLREMTKPEPVRPSLPTHQVAAGETLFSICRDTYGDGSLAEKLASFNNIKDPASLREGHRLRMPGADELRGKAAASANAPGAARPPATAVAMVDYTLQKGDTLAKVAKRFCGPKATWNDIYDLNKSVIDDPDNVRVGITIKVPRQQ